MNLDSFNGAWLLSAILVPVTASLLLLLVPAGARALQRAVALAGFGWPLVTALLAWAAFGQGATAAGAAAGGWLFPVQYDTGLSAVGIELRLGLNGIALPMYVMAGAVGLAAALFAMTREVERPRLLFGLLLVVQAGLMGMFSTYDAFFLYFFHEVAMIPTLIAIATWGGAGRKGTAIEVGVYLTLGALLSLFGIIALVQVLDVGSYDLRRILEEVRHAWATRWPAGHVAFGLLLVGFGILVSLFPFHTWAPRAYVTAPTPISMLHAGVLKKFGLYAMLQLGAPLLLDVGAANWLEPMIWLALGNVIIIGFITIAQRDLKFLVAYSSVMHMGYAFLGLASVSVAGFSGVVLMMFAHGLTVAAMFALASFVQRRTGTWDLYEMGGLARTAPALAVLFTTVAFAGIGLPGFAGFWGEVVIFQSLVAAFAGTSWWGPWVVGLAVFGIVISAVYALRAVARVFFGEPSTVMAAHSERYPVTDLNGLERGLAVGLLALLLAVGLWPNLFAGHLQPAVQAVFHGTAAGTMAPAQPLHTAP